ncbi:MAG: type III secretion chaperone SycN [Deltaproteobacteria bacterium]|jgi:type III secretion system chaperone SycN|nr:type III secretion chaperone SycN [Deltaproteobacteria bacterium]
MYEHVISEFGRRMGLPALDLERDKPIQLHIEGMGTLFLEKSNDNVEAILLYLAREFPAHDHDVPRRALGLCGPDFTRPFPVYAGLYKDNILFFLTRFTQKDFSLQALEQAVLILSGLLDETLLER